MTKTKEEKSLARTIRYRENDIDRLNEKITKLENERGEFRKHFSDRFRLWVELQGNGQNPTSLTWLIDADAKFLARVSPFKW
jgi:hypothetical protein